jgi:hypothetical protein
MKIHKHSIDPNFLTHVLWSKYIVGKKQAHLELLLILHYQITKENKHILRINIFDHTKICD